MTSCALVGHEGLKVTTFELAEEDELAELAAVEAAGKLAEIVVVVVTV